MSRIYDYLTRSRNFQNIEAATVFEGIIENFRATATTSGVDLREQIEPITIPRKIPVLLAIILNELVTNSIKYAFPEGIEKPKMSVFVELGQRGEGHLQLVISDTGTGFPESVLEGSYGFGLSMVKSLVEQLEGNMELTNTSKPQVRVENPMENRLS